MRVRTGMGTSVLNSVNHVLMNVTHVLSMFRLVLSKNLIQGLRKTVAPTAKAQTNKNSLNCSYQRALLLMEKLKKKEFNKLAALWLNKKLKTEKMTWQ